MKRRWIIRLSLTGLALGLARAGWLKVDGDPGLMFIYFIFMGVAVALLTAKWVLPWMIEVLTASLFFPSEKVRYDESEEAEQKDSNHREDG